MAEKSLKNLYEDSIDLKVIDEFEAREKPTFVSSEEILMILDTITKK
ncbi:MAG: hypothetical protein JW875_08155 [Spirochaetales bacterium]|nr:hypothetical protein [Spirochaetales bacterium]